MIRRIARGIREWYWGDSPPLTSLRCGAFTLQAPRDHMLLHLGSRQPHRNRGIAIAAARLGAKYPEGSFIDIGANIGDTAAVMATHADNPLVLVEANPYYFELLKQNSALIPNPTDLHQVLVGDGQPVRGRWKRWFGTAEFVPDADGEAQQTLSLSELEAGEACLVKVDTDGQDYAVVRGAIDWIAECAPALFLECEVRGRDQACEAQAAMAQLHEAGYRQFVVFDDAGLHLLSTTDLQIVRDLIDYLAAVWAQGGRRSIFYYDVLCLHDRDRDVFEDICAADFSSTDPAAAGQAEEGRP